MKQALMTLAVAAAATACALALTVLPLPEADATLVGASATPRHDSADKSHRARQCIT
jgi:hypothetical protein